MRNSIGDRGESIFEVLITKHTNTGGSLFTPTFFGEKHELIDYHVDLKNHAFPAFFHASIKTTGLGYTKTKRVLRVTIRKNEKAALAQCTVPTYVFGIDEKKEKGYFVCANKGSNKLIYSNISIKYPITQRNLNKLYREVSTYWKKSRKITKFVSSFN